MYEDLSTSPDISWAEDSNRNQAICCRMGKIVFMHALVNEKFQEVYDVATIINPRLYPKTWGVGVANLNNGNDNALNATVNFSADTHKISGLIKNSSGIITKPAGSVRISVWWITA